MVVVARRGLTSVPELTKRGSAIHHAERTRITPRAHKKPAVPTAWSFGPCSSEHQVADWFRTSRSSPCRLRAKGAASWPSCCCTSSLPGRLVRYVPEDVEAMIEAGRTSGAPAAE